MSLQVQRNKISIMGRRATDYVAGVSLLRRRRIAGIAVAI
jgi:hypothetical protein